MVLSQFRFVEVGRVAYISSGRDAGKLAVIVDVIDQNRALIDGPCSGVSRQQMNFKALQLTSIVMKISRGLRPGNLAKAWEKQEVQKKWDSTTWAKKIANKKKRAQLTDFDRFKLMKAKQARNRLINVEFGKLRKTTKKPAPKPRKRKSVKK
ncbi:large ribosomal subunit protein eL14-like [Crassostrea virginica]|uniref:Large ribosomal subunit protein eL14 n=1 Tax=Crassostrea virginica TaxID=6565 RepID=A0A8B8ERV2_CRAVI|nr:60S ribosomal protein L14-like [Crassostrea virginica]|mmetsp:Transcript_17278/g.37749  ORF Transcript_17278/g.37749 Transcript_17278/m.37749 type:complete len:152 (-) Transcript_17278:8-463(-)|eukprot:CAMPEP_0203757436 /NCGR_PEP_ID=MMETSP0098-20131031/10500_1 /ASSEMBLY_ACC=CAM_ASM_000208 /TAXON_ID=96639 /ORGANISM=" , Strain NY0313808BC1" /LENGTH=151 /DNA_ID=CAMNT_0050649645 /DNA_START=49 /DNA_END=504 /DNA_ORIENTATION=-